MRAMGSTPDGAVVHEPLASATGMSTDPVQPWAIVLAGGAGIRLQPLTRIICGDERPKQYVRLFGSRSMLRQTLDRLAVAIPAEQTVAVVTQAHARYISEEFGIARTPRRIVQPTDRGTATAILLAAQWISWRDPDAVVAVFPSDHLILGELTFMAHIMSVAAFVERHPERLLLLGVRPTEAEMDYGWIEPQEPIGRINGMAVSTVGRFREKPSAREARKCLTQGCLWNTGIMVAKARTLVEAGRRVLPALTERLSRIESAAGSEYEPFAISGAYDSLERANFSRDVLERCASVLAVTSLPVTVTWLDLGSPNRVIRGLHEAGLAPSWLTVLKARKTPASWPRA